MPLVIAGEVCRIGLLDGATDLDLTDHDHYFAYVPEVADVPQGKYAENRGDGRRLQDNSFPGPTINFRVYLCAKKTVDGELVDDLDQQDLDVQAIAERLDDATLASVAQGQAGPYQYFEWGYPGITRTRKTRIARGWTSETRADMGEIFRGLMYTTVTIEGTR